MADVCSDLAHCQALRLQPLRMTTGHEGPAAGRWDKAERPAPGARCQKCLRGKGRVQGEEDGEKHGVRGGQASSLRTRRGRETAGPHLIPSLILPNHSPGSMKLGCPCRNPP